MESGMGPGSCSCRLSHAFTSSRAKQLNGFTYFVAFVNCVLKLAELRCKENKHNNKELEIFLPHIQEHSGCKVIYKENFTEFLSLNTRNFFPNFEKFSFTNLSKNSFHFGYFCTYLGDIFSVQEKFPHIFLNMGKHSSIYEKLSNLSHLLLGIISLAGKILFFCL